MKRLSVLCLALVAILAGCGMNRPAPESIQQARLTIREAELAKAQDLAAMDLYSAREKLDKAESLVSEDPDAAWRYAEESKADAQLALTKSQEATLQQSYDSARQGIDTVYGVTKKKQ